MLNITVNVLCAVCSYTWIENKIYPYQVWDCPNCGNFGSGQEKIDGVFYRKHPEVAPKKKKIKPVKQLDITWPVVDMENYKHIYRDGD